MYAEVRKIFKVDEGGKHMPDQYFEEECKRQGGKVFSGYTLHLCEIPLRGKDIPVEKIMKLRTAALRKSLPDISEEFEVTFYDPDAKHTILEYKLERTRISPDKVTESLSMMLPISRDLNRSLIADIANWLISEREKYRLLYANIEEVKPFESKVYIDIGLSKEDESKRILSNVLPALKEFYGRAFEENKRRIQISNRTVVV